MFEMHNVEMRTTVKKTELLKTLHANLEAHSRIVQEARDGYVKKAKAALEGRLEKLRTGKIVSLKFDLSPPLDYSAVYQTAIKMLEWNTADEVELHAGEFRQLVLDQWDWTKGFYVTSSAYSPTAIRKMGEGEQE